MKFYVPSLIRCGIEKPHWGDEICTTWASEMLAHLDPSAEIVLDPTFYGKKTFHSINEWIKTPWAHDHQVLSLTSAASKFDKIVATHHRHLLSGYPTISGDKYTFFDAHGLSFRMIHDGWFPSFIPTDKTNELFAALKLPEDYVAVHVNDNTSDGRNVLPARAFYEKNAAKLKQWADDRLIVTTGAPIDPSIVPSLDLSAIHPWLAIYVMIGATKAWGSLSGFTAIASTYTGRRNFDLVNDPGVPGFNLGPPNIAYSNYNVASFGSYDKLYYAIEQGLIPSSAGAAYAKRSHNRHWCQFETFDFDAFEEPPAGYVAKPFYENIDNCLVPLDAKYSSPGTDKLWDFRVDDEMTSLPIMAWIPRKR